MASSEIERLDAKWPGLPPNYLTYLRDIGWGQAPRGHMIYSGPISPGEVYPRVSGDKDRLLIGDDMQGYCLGYDRSTKRCGEFSDSGHLSSFDESFDLATYLADVG